MNLDSMWAEYKKEREGVEIISLPYGFVAFKDLPDINAIYIEDIFVKKESRREKVGTYLADEVSKVAKSRERSKLIGSVVPSTPGSHESVLSLITYGFKLRSSELNLIYFEKEI